MIRLICGDRNWADKVFIRNLLIAAIPETSRPHVIIIHGDNGYDVNHRPLYGCPDEDAVFGVDKLAGAVAIELGFKVERYPADWIRYGKQAGPLRNRTMLYRLMHERELNRVWALHDNIETSRGTLNCITEARRMGIPVSLFSHEQHKCFG